MTSGSDTEAPLRKLTRAQEIFKGAPQEYQTLIREVLKDERDVMYMKTRPEIHQKIYNHVKRVIK